MVTGINLLTGEQIRAARALARIDQAGLALRCGLSLETIRRLERTHGVVDANVSTLTEITDVFRALGVVFEETDGGGLGLRLLNPNAPLMRTQAPASWQPPSRGTRLSTVHRLIYCSTLNWPDGEQPDSALAEILHTSTVRNKACGVNGALLVCDGRTLGLLEGPRSAVFDLYGLIAMDQSHHGLEVIESSDVVRTPGYHAPMVCAALQSTDPRLAETIRGHAGFRPETFSTEGAMRVLDIVRGDPFASQSALRPERADPYTARRHQSARA